MVSRQRAFEAVRAEARSSDEVGELLSLLDDRKDHELEQWMIGDQDDYKTICAFIRAKAKVVAVGLGLGSATGAGATTSVEEILRTIVANQKTIVANQKTIMASQHTQEKQFSFMSGLCLVGVKQAFRPPSSGQESHCSNSGFRNDVTTFYGTQTSGKKMTCMVLGKAVPSRFLVAGHLFAWRWMLYADVMMGTDFSVHSPRNGIMWNSAIEYEYEHQRICFSYGGLEGNFVLHVLDKSLLPVKLSSVGQHKSDPDFVKVLGGVTFEDLHNKPVYFSSTDGRGPFKRALVLHAKLALEHCKKTYPDDFDPQEYNFDTVSEHEGKEEFVRMWLSKLDTGSVAEEGVNEEVEAAVDPEESVDKEKVAEAVVEGA